MKDYNFVGVKLRQLRESYKLSQRVLGECISVNHSCIAQIETGDRLPSEETIEEYVKFFGISRSDIFTNEILESYVKVFFENYQSYDIEKVIRALNKIVNEENNNGN